MYCKNRADKLLLIVFLLFLSSVVMRHTLANHWVLEAYSAFIEAALIGGVADWFAVTALFKKPLGFGWHTALIPRNRSKIINAIADVVQKEFLSTDIIKNRILCVNFTQMLLSWLDNGKGNNILTNVILEYMRDIVTSSDKHKIAEYLQSKIRDSVQKQNVAPYINDFLHWLVNSGRAEQVIDYLIIEAQRKVESGDISAEIYQYLKTLKRKQADNGFAKFLLWFGEQTDSLNILELSEALTRNLNQALCDLKCLDNTVRVWIRNRMYLTVNELDKNFPFEQSVKRWKDEVAGQLEVKQLIAEFVSDLAVDLNGELENPESWIRQWVMHEVNKIVESLRNDDSLREELDNNIKNALCYMVDMEHSIVGEIAYEALKHFDEKKLNEFIEEKVGDDLIWIRINGSVVGGIIGLSLFLLTKGIALVGM